MVPILYASLIKLVQTAKNNFDNFEAAAKLFSHIQEHKTTMLRKNKRKKFNMINLKPLILKKV